MKDFELQNNNSVKNKGTFLGFILTATGVLMLLSYGIYEFYFGIYLQNDNTYTKIEAPNLF